MLSRFIPFVIVLSLIASASSAYASNVPVFRFALEQWPNDDFMLHVVHRGELSADQLSLVNRLYHGSRDRIGTANVVVDTSDPAGQIEPGLLKTWKAQGSPNTPWIIVRLAESKAGECVWTGPLTERNVEGLLDSPARHKMIKEIVSGNSAVWLLIDGEDQAENDREAALLATESARLAGRLKLPERLSGGGYETNSKTPLQIAFATVRIRYRDARETQFVGMLRGIFPEVKDARGPIVVPVYGRGRALTALTGERLTEKRLADAAAFLTRRCSEISERIGSGLDLLVSTDWDKRIDPDRPMPTIHVGIGPAVPGRLPAPDANGTVVSDSPPLPQDPSKPPEMSTRLAVTTNPKTTELDNAPSGEPSDGFSRQHLVWMAGVCLVIVVAVTAFVLFRQRKWL